MDGENQGMIRNLNTRLVLILLIAALAIWVDATDVIQIRNPLDDTILYERNIAPRLGLDLQGGLQVLLEAEQATAQDMKGVMGDFDREPRSEECRQDRLDVAKKGRPADGPVRRPRVGHRVRWSGSRSTVANTKASTASRWPSRCWPRTG